MKSNYSYLSIEKWARKEGFGPLSEVGLYTPDQAAVSILPQAKESCKHYNLLYG